MTATDCYIQMKNRLWKYKSLIYSRARICVSFEGRKGAPNSEIWSVSHISEKDKGIGQKAQTIKLYSTEYILECTFYNSHRKQAYLTFFLFLITVSMFQLDLKRIYSISHAGETDTGVSIA